MTEPVKTSPNPAGVGKPIISEEQFQSWLDDMRQFLKQGSTLWYAMDKSGILSHATVIYEKYRSGDWFAQKVDAYRATPGELINKIGVTVIQNIHNKQVETDGKVPLTKEEVTVWKTMAEKHRSAQPFFVNRTETGESDPEDLGKVLDIMSGDYGEFNDDNSTPDAGSTEQPASGGDQQEASTTETVPASPEQEVENDAPLQNPKQEW